MTFAVTRRRFAAALLTASSLGLSGCFMTPGTFGSTLDIRSDGRFSFTYDGEIFMAGLSDFAEMAAAEEANKPCVDDETFEERACTEEEVAARKAEKEQEARMMAMMMGGVDPDDPEAAANVAAELERQAGWNTVTYLGDGLFYVDFAITSTISNDFAYPVLEGQTMGSAFVAVNLRDEGRAKIAAPGFAAQGGNPFQAMMGGMAGMFSGGGEDDAEEDSEEASGASGFPDVPPMRGTFRIVTDAAILTNNTDEGPREEAGLQVLEWDIEPTTAVAPTALLNLGD